LERNLVIGYSLLVLSILVAVIDVASCVAFGLGDWWIAPFFFIAFAAFFSVIFLGKATY